MKVHFIVPAAFVRLSGNDVKSRYVVLPLSRSQNALNPSLRTVPYRIFTATKSNLNGVHLDSVSWPISFSFAVKKFDALRISA